jgi:hypothetical protein
VEGIGGDAYVAIAVRSHLHHIKPELDAPPHPAAIDRNDLLACHRFAILVLAAFLAVELVDRHYE